VTLKFYRCEETEEGIIVRITVNDSDWTEVVRGDEKVVGKIVSVLERMGFENNGERAS
jgi:hypothetical protein